MNIYPYIELNPPLISTAHIKEKIVCIRGHRERIFFVAPEKKDHQYIFHNYGQGGAGLTFLFGCVYKSIRQFEQILQNIPSYKRNPICVIGAGCYGLLTACILASKGYKVKIIADTINALPSYNAAGFFFPRHRRSSTTSEIAEYQICSMESFITYKSIMEDNHPFIKKGPKLLPCYYDVSINPGLENFVHKGLLEVPRQVQITFGNATTYKVIRHQVLFINAHELMHELQTAQAHFNIPIEQKKIDNFQELDETIIFNCTGLGARDLTDDKKIIPVQGHLIALYNQPYKLDYLLNVKAPINQRHNIEPHKLIYFTPKNEGLLGITFLRGKKALQENNHEFEKILTRCQAYFGY